MDLRCGRALGLLAVLAALAVLAVLTAGPLLAGVPAAGEAGWRWPLDPPVAVVAGFRAPPGPYAPGHRGVDLKGWVGQPVRAAGAGVVAFVGRVAGRGVVSVDHAGGLRTWYEPVTATVAPGDHIAAGALLGGLGALTSHCAPAACLHWGLRRGETYLDPRALLGTARVRLLPVWGATLPAGEPATPPGAAPATVAAGESTPLRSVPRPTLRPQGADRGSGAARLAVGAAAAVVGTATILLRRRRPAASSQ